MSGNFISELKRKRCSYSHPDQASTQARSLDLLSSGIYTEEERFVFELLQNAVDAYSKDGCLDIQILLTGNYLVFMHNGDPFTERDVEGLCDVGYGNKMDDIRKIGYKGIGFKSVFRHSKCVTVESGIFCFKFEKDAWTNYWDPIWGPKDPTRDFSMPWQIIPIETTPPVSINKNGYNVINYIFSTNVDALKSKVDKLLQKSNFLLFLRHSHINVDFVIEDKHIRNIRKSMTNNIVDLSIDGVSDGRWLVYNNYEVPIPSSIREIVRLDGITPVKLQEAKSFDLSFAVSINKGTQIEEVKQSIVYTYLPTSISLDFPFLVNANFITDAGRQHLVNDSEWNRMIMKTIPVEFLTWISKISSSQKYYYKVLPHRVESQDALRIIFNEALTKAIEEIAFIPSKHKGLLRASEAIMDRIGIAEAITESSFIAHINRKYTKNYTTNSLINVGGVTILKEYGVFIFNSDKIQALFEDTETFMGIDIEQDKKLINFLFKYYQDNEKERFDLEHILCSSKFLLSEYLILDCPENLYYPSVYREQEEIAKGAKFLHPSLAVYVTTNTSLCNWLKKIGVSEMNDISIIKNHLCKEGFVNEHNAVDVLRFVFQANRKSDVFEQVGPYTLSNILILTKKGSLKKADELYFGSEFKPNVDIEAFCNDDIFPSRNYCNGNDIGEWYNFLKRFGVNDSFELKKRVIKREDAWRYPVLQEAINPSEKVFWTSWDGRDFYFYCTGFSVSYIPLVKAYIDDNYELSKVIWNSALSKEPIVDVDDIKGYSGWINRILVLSYFGMKMTFLEYMIKNKQTFPGSNGKMLKSSELFRNTPIARELYGPYLPYIDVECEINEKWLNYFQFKQEPGLSDFLLLLNNISEDQNNAEQNKDRICKIYQRIVDNFQIFGSSYAEKIRLWGANHKVLAQDGKFYYPKELRHITLDGFSSKGRVYIGTSDKKEKVIELLKLMGVTVITENSVSPKFHNPDEKSELKSCLEKKIKVLALLKAGEKPSKTVFDNAKESITHQLRDSHFYHCSSIKLSYGDNDDTIEKATFGLDNNFYYTGELRLAKVDPLLTPLCSYLKIKGKERELMITMFEDMNSIREYLKGKEYDISYLEDVEDDRSHIFITTLDNNRTESERRRDARTGYKGEIIVYEKLKSLGYEPVCPSISNESDYEEILEVNGKTYYCKPNMGRYDISFMTHSGIEMLVEVKSTTLNKQSQENMPISYREISMVEECNNVKDKSYVIARVFNTDSSSPDIFLFKGHLLND